MSSPTAPPDDARLDALHQEFEHEASFSKVFVVFKVGATLMPSHG